MSLFLDNLKERHIIKMWFFFFPTKIYQFNYKKMEKKSWVTKKEKWKISQLKTASAVHACMSLKIEFYAFTR